MKEDDWSAVLDDHPIFKLPKNVDDITGHAESSLELSTNTLKKFTDVASSEDGPTPSGRRQVMLLKNEDLIVAAGHELRMTSLGDSKLGRSAKKAYKVCGIYRWFQVVLAKHPHRSYIRPTFNLRSIRWP